MKALSIRQPWAHLILCGLKDVESRTWSTEYRGPLLIHAGQKLQAGWEAGVMAAVQPLLHGLYAADIYHEALIGADPLERTITAKRGWALGIVDLIDVVTESDSPWFEGPYGWVLANPRPLPVPFELKGRLGLFEVAFDGD